MTKTAFIDAVCQAIPETALSALRKAVVPPQRTRAKQAAAQKTPAKKRPGKRTR